MFLFLFPKYIFFNNLLLPLKRFSFLVVVILAYQFNFLSIGNANYSKSGTNCSSAIQTSNTSSNTSEASNSVPTKDAFEVYAEPVSERFPSISYIQYLISMQQEMLLIYKLKIKDYFITPAKGQFILLDELNDEGFDQSWLDFHEFNLEIIQEINKNTDFDDHKYNIFIAHPIFEEGNLYIDLEHMNKESLKIILELQNESLSYLPKPTSLIEAQLNNSLIKNSAFLKFYLENPQPIFTDIATIDSKTRRGLFTHNESIFLKQLMWHYEFIRRTKGQINHQLKIENEWDLN